MKDSVQSNSSSSLLVSVSAANAAQYPTKNAKKVSLFYCDETKTLAEKIAAESDAIELRNINWRLTFLLHFDSFIIHLPISFILTNVVFCFRF